MQNNQGAPLVVPCTRSLRSQWRESTRGLPIIPLRPSFCVLRCVPCLCPMPPGVPFQIVGEIWRRNIGGLVAIDFIRMAECECPPATAQSESDPVVALGIVSASGPCHFFAPVLLLFSLAFFMPFYLISNPLVRSVLFLAAANQAAVYRAMRKALRKDWLQTKVAPISELGVMQLTRERVSAPATAWGSASCSIHTVKPPPPPSQSLGTASCCIHAVTCPLPPYHR